MAFGDVSFENTLPPYLSQPNKTRLKEGLSQFFEVDHRKKDKRYDHFYLENPPDFFMQGDVINSVAVYDWDDASSQYTTGYSPVVMISSTCDIFEDNNKLIDKEALFATLIPLMDFLQDLEAEGFTDDNIKSIHSNLKQQLYSNLFYLPPNPIDGREFVVFFDKTFWHPSIKFLEKREHINEERFISLDHFGFYLFICKLSYHFCRVPEDCHRSK